MKTLLLLLFGALFCSFTCIAYKPVVLIHGIMAEKGSLTLLANRIREAHPGTEIYMSDRFNGWSSLVSMWHQVKAFGSDLMNVSSSHPDGIHLIGFSQGGLISRGILESFPGHNVKTFISLSSPQAGQYGTKFLHLFFPNLWKKTAYELFYSEVGQYTSVANYWNDPYHQSLYYRYSAYLPQLNNEIITSNSENQLASFSSLEHLVLIGGPDDGVITPWQSSHFGYYNMSDEVVEMRDREIYSKDLFGLKTLDSFGKITTIVCNGVQHFDWHLNLSVIDNHIIPYLD
ncbi:lysosomal thioesterase PPT2 homolog [Ischnura elegans]|uniref:lysosomal thioesterase PPT2 homolog n=1 Tax=Ischnura elegans TaxID=197161 RepID=UPI001ED87903|nr:lysosomal thioesterase PPT2 homolog [Ischnura elegans]